MLHVVHRHSRWRGGGAGRHRGKREVDPVQLGEAQLPPQPPRGARREHGLQAGCRTPPGRIRGGDRRRQAAGGIPRALGHEGPVLMPAGPCERRAERPGICLRAADVAGAELEQADPDAHSATLLRRFEPLLRSPPDRTSADSPKGSSRRSAHRSPVETKRASEQRCTAAARVGVSEVADDKPGKTAPRTSRPPSAVFPSRNSVAASTSPKSASSHPAPAPFPAPSFQTGSHSSCVIESRGSHACSVRSDTRR